MTSVLIRRLPRLAPTWEDAADVVVVGAGAAGISAALAASNRGRDVILLVKGGLGSGATAWAQGGLAAVLGEGDSFDLHSSDTLIAGAGLCDEAAVRALVAAAPGELQLLRRLGARFDLADLDRTFGGRTTSLALTREGGHSADRVVHAGGDATGAEVDRTLTAALRRSRVRVLEQTVALDALLDARGSVVGLLASRVGAHGLLEPGLVHSASVILATGGLGQAWATTTNPRGATGSGLALALRAGAQVRDAEFVQFHPTVLFQGTGARGQQLLITEALRGEGAVLIDGEGRRVMAGLHPAGDLAPRDVVAAAIHARLARLPGDVGTHVYLDATSLGRTLLEQRFPTVLAGCRAVGIDPVTQPIPVAPGAHYSCGGVLADLSGRTSVPGLFAVGEVAATGVHGANRLASNSIPEALVTGRRAGELVAKQGGAPVDVEHVASPGGDLVDPASRDDMAAHMSRSAGVLRSGSGLQRLLDHLATVPGLPISGEGFDLATVEATDLHTVSTVVAAAALHRQESRGSHRRSDFREEDSSWSRHVSWQLEEEELRVVPAERRAAA